jgi:hypothetical protein
MVTMATKGPAVTMNHPRGRGRRADSNARDPSACQAHPARTDGSDRRVGPLRPDGTPRHAAARRRGRDVLGPCQGFWLRYSSPLA